MTRTAPPVGPPTAVRFPDIARRTLDNGLRVWVIEQVRVPTATAVLLVDRGSAADPVHLPGLAGAAVDLLDEGAGSRKAIELAGAFGDLGTELVSEVGPDVSWLSFSSLARVFGEALALLADVVARPHLYEADFRRVIELRSHQLQQRSRSAGMAADRTLVGAMFSGHPYGHGTLGTSRALGAMRADDARAFWTESVGPAAATLVIAGDVRASAAFDMAAGTFGGWRAPGSQPFAVPELRSAGEPAVLFVARPGAAQSEVRVGHIGPPRKVDDFHGLLVLDAILGGQFTSRINRNLREAKGLTYGARTSFGFRRAGGSFVCDASVQSDRTAEAVSEILREFAEIRRPGSVVDAELERARASLSRGYVRNFETASQYARAAVQLATYDLDDRTFDRFVPSVEAVGPADVERLAVEHIRPDEAVIVVVGDPAQRPLLEGLGRPVSVVTPEF
ncbi:MAG TPA: pitrilysin family protein [Vicinamibacterales bacterium]|nr:pitrilysin family protein [Vicinamibacterales bacterium]